MGVEGSQVIVEATEDKAQLISLCGINAEQTEIDFSSNGVNGLDAGDAVLLAFDLKKNSRIVRAK